jgi:Fur family transcriptional regulator, zinc uptake regulator
MRLRREIVFRFGALGNGEGGSIAGHVVNAGTNTTAEAARQLVLYYPCCGFAIRLVSGGQVKNAAEKSAMAGNTSDSQKTKERGKSPVDYVVEIFAEKNIRFTDLRRKVFEEIASTPTSVGAYEVLDRLARKGTRLAPISVYRALDALLEAGVVHRLESKNAYFACRRLDKPRTGRRPMFMSCEKCGAVQEVDGDHIFKAIDEAAESVSFDPRVKFVEVSGTCLDCAGRRKG